MLIQIRTGSRTTRQLIVRMLIGPMVVASLTVMPALLIAGCDNGTENAPTATTQASSTSASSGSNGEVFEPDPMAVAEASLTDVPVFHTPEALIAYLQEILARPMHPVREWYSLLWYDTSKEDERNCYYFMGHFTVPRFLLAQAVTRNFKAPYRISKAPLYPYQIMIPTQLSPDRVEVECKDDTGRLEYLYLRRVGDRWMIDISSYKTQMTWERQSEFHKKSWNELNNVPSEMQTVIRRMDAGDFADAGEAMRAAEMLLPGGKLRDGEPPETTITTTDMPKSSDGPAPNPADG
ncbi:MAG: hypothetical protein KC983_10985 [Phycisphaerales bacterium]|nr:hypothetical protein [Phycisphaerales bacterium]